MTLNVGARGRIVDAAGRGRSGLLVDATDGEGSEAPFLGRTRTREDGTFEVSWTTAMYRSFVHWRPDLVLTVLDPSGIRPVARIGPRKNTNEEVAVAPDITLTEADVRGWAVTEARGVPLHVSRGNWARPLVDGELAFAAVRAAVRAARSHVHISQLLFEPEFATEFGVDGPRRLVDDLVDAAKRGVVVRALLNENALVPDNVNELRDAFSGAALPDRLIVRAFPTTPEVMHAKCVIVDDVEGFSVGSPFERRWWDTRAHPLDDARRGKGQPMHDVTLHVRGPVVADLSSFFAWLWNREAEKANDGSPPLAPIAAPPPAGDIMLQVAHTLPDALKGPGTGRGILEAYERAFANAEEYVYVETQYLTSRSIFRTLERALEAKPKLEAILLVNDVMDAPMYGPAMEAGLARLGFPDEPRVGAFARWIGAEVDGELTVQSVYLHSKTAVADDVWATIGSANLDGYALDSADELHLPGVRSVETNLLVFDGIEGAPASGFARALREDLWSEHLGAPVAGARRPAVGWLSMWREAGARSLRALEAGTVPRGFVLPYKTPLPENVRERKHDVNVKNKPIAKKSSN